jgi:hypothetical protein
MSEQDHDGSMSENEEAWFAEDPDITIGEVTVIVQVERRSPEASTGSTSDPTVRKKTSPMSMYSVAPSKVARPFTIVFDAEQGDPPAHTTKSASVLTESTLVNAGTQTEPVRYTKSITTTTIVKENGRKIKAVKKGEMLLLL